MSIPSLELMQDSGIGLRKEELENEALEEGQSALIQACLKGDLEAIARILKAQPRLRGRCASAEDSRTPVMIAAGYQDDAKALAMVELLQEAGADIRAVAEYPDERNSDDDAEEDKEKEITTTLREACKHGNIQTAAYLLKQDPSLAQSVDDDICDDHTDTRTPLMVAVQHEDEDKALALTKLLVEANADIRTVAMVRDKDVDRENHGSTTTAFLQACKQGHLKVVEYLLKKNSSLANETPRNVKWYEDGRTPLIIVAGYKEDDKALALVELLLKHHADIHAVASGGSNDEPDEDCLHGKQTAFLAACRRGNIKVADRFLQEDPSVARKPVTDVFSCSNRPMFPTIVAVKLKDEDKALALIKLLLAPRADVPDATPKEYEGVFFQACELGKAKVVGYLLEQYPYLADKPNKKGNTSLMIAAKCNDDDKASALVELLLKREVDVHAVASGNDASYCRGVIALSKACQKGNIKVASSLLQAVPSLANKPGFSSLIHEVVVYSSVNDEDKVLALLTLLLEHKGDIHAMDLIGFPNPHQRAAFFTACGLGKTKVVRFLLDRFPSFAKERGYENRTPLMITIEDQSQRLFSLLPRLTPGITESPGSVELRARRRQECHDQTVAIVKDLLAFQADIDAVDDQGRFATHLAASLEQWEIVTILLKRNPKNLDANVEGETVLGLAIAAGQWDNVRTLLKQGANPDVMAKVPGRVPPQRDFALRHVLAKKEDPLFRLFLKRGVSLQLKDNPAVTLRHYSEILSRDISKESTRLWITFDAAKTLFDIAKEESKLSDEDRRSLRNSLQELGLALNGRVDGETALQAAIRKRNELIQKLGERNGPVIKTKEELLEAIKAKEEFIGELLVAGAALFLSDKEEAEARAVSLPIVQAFVALKDFNNCVETFIKFKEMPSEQDSKEGKESKETSERHAEILKNVYELPEKILKITKELSPRDRNKLCYELGVCLEKTLPYTGGESSENIKLIVEAFAQVSYEGGRELHEKANAKLLHYQILSKGKKMAKGRNMDRGLGISGLEEDAEMRDIGVLALQAKRETDPTFLGQTLVARIFPVQDRPCIFGQIRPEDPYELNVSRGLDVMQKEVSRLHREISNLRKEKEKLESRISKSSIPYSSLSLDPEVETKQESERVRSSQALSSSSSSQASNSASSSQSVGAALPEPGSKGAVAHLADVGEPNPDPLVFSRVPKSEEPKGEKRKQLDSSGGSLGNENTSEFRIKREKSKNF